MKVDLCDIRRQFRAYFFASDRDVSLQSDRYFFLGSGTQVTDSCFVPIGGIILWSGSVASIPANWQICDGTNSTPDLRNSFVIGAGDTYAVDATGGSTTKDLSHTHGPGTLATDTQANHTHGDGSYAAANDQHSHGDGSYATDSDQHDHGPGTLNMGGASIGFGGSAGSDYTFATTDHKHGWIGGATASDTHSHDVTGTSANDTHNHDVTGTSGTGGSHAHDVDSGTTASGGSATQDIMPPYYSLAYIRRMS